MVELLYCLLPFVVLLLLSLFFVFSLEVLWLCWQSLHVALLSWVLVLSLVVSEVWFVVGVL